MKGGTSLEELSKISEHVAPLGQAGMKLFQQFLEAGVDSALKGTKGK